MVTAYAARIMGIFLMSRFANRLTNSLFLAIVIVIHYFL